MEFLIPNSRAYSSMFNGKGFTKGHYGLQSLQGGQAVLARQPGARLLPLRADLRRGISQLLSSPENGVCLPYILSLTLLTSSGSLTVI